MIISRIGCVSQTENQEQALQTSLQKSWPIFRGDQGLNGVANGSLPDKIELLWTYKTEDDIKSSPVVGLETVFVGSGDGNVYALDLATGSKKWQFDTKNNVEAAPLLVEQKIFIGSSGGIFFALNALTGKLIWSHETDGKISGSANWIHDADKTKKLILAGSYDNLMYCFDADNGKLRWTYETEYYINGAPATDGEIVVFGGCDEKLHIVSGQNGTKIGEVSTGSYIAGS
jgi:outer membrane protein assembly factor BamB